MLSFQEFKKDYFVSNKDLLSKVKPDLHHEMMLAAYEKIHNKARCSDYYTENKEEINRRHKEYYERNRDKIQEKRKMKYEQNKNDINEKRKENVDCECGCLIQKGHLSRHIKTTKHANLLKQSMKLNKRKKKNQLKFLFAVILN